MAQKTLEAYVVLGGRVDNTFGEIGQVLINLGGQIDEISERLLNFGKESLNVYQSYEDNMLAAEGALASRYGKDSTLLKGIMNDLDAAAKQWASATIFHTDDVGNAILQAARASWSFEEIMDGIPAAMKLAQAGGLDLSQALDYIITSTKAAGIELEDLERWVDNWAFAANSSAGTIEEFGEAIDKMGATSRFAANQEELLTMLAALHSQGTKGSAAGTLLRNTMLRLIAPTKKASDAMKKLNISEEEMAEALGESNGDMDAAIESLNRFGFSVYDEYGNLKGFVQIFTELNDAIQGMNEQERNNVLASMFPTRTITGAMAFLDYASKGFDGLYASMEAGDAEGYGEYLSELMMSGLTGSTELLLSKVENLKLIVGESLSPEIQKIEGWIGSIVDKVAGMDNKTFNAIVGGLEVISFAGPGLYIAGRALRFIGNLLTPAGIVGMGAVTLAAIVSAIHEIEEADFSGQFGDMNLDMGTLNEYVKTLGDDFNTAFERVRDFAGALDTAVENYEKASTTFSSDLLTAMLTKKELTPEEKQAFEQMGIDIYEQVLASINASSDMAAEFWNALYGGDNVAAADPKYQKILELLNAGNAQAIAQAESVSERLKAAMLKGFEKGFTEDDYQTILGLFEEYYALIAEAQAEAFSDAQLIEQEIALHKAQTASLEDTVALAKTVTEQRDAQLAEYDKYYESARAATMIAAMKSGMTREEAENALAESDVEKKNAEFRANTAANYDEFLNTLWQTVIKSSDLTNAFGTLGKYAQLYMSGQLTAGTVLDFLTQELGESKYAGVGNSKTSERAQLGKIMGLMISSFGGEEATAEKVEYYAAIGQTDKANQYRTLLAMEQLVNGFTTIERTERPVWDWFNLTDDFVTTGSYSENTGEGIIKQIANNQNLSMLESMLGLDAKRYTLDMMRDTISLLDGYGGLSGMFDALRSYLTEWDGWSLGRYNMSAASTEEYNRMYDVLSQTYDLTKVYSDMMARDETGNLTEGNVYRSDLAMYDLLYGEASKNTAQYLLPGQTEAETYSSGYSIEGGADAAEGAYNEAQEKLDELGDLTSGLDVTGGAAAASAEHAAAQEWAVQHPVYFSAELVGTPFGGAYMAEGGRATEPVVFGEAGPEWFIPEKHTPQTAQLILQTAHASGFTLADLAEIEGATMFAEGGTTGTAVLQWSGLPDASSSSESSDSGSGSGGGIQVQYSPVIHADNASGVERALKEDKKRFQKWIEEWWHKKELYESLVTYQ